MKADIFPGLKLGDVEANISDVSCCLNSPDSKDWLKHVPTITTQTISDAFTQRVSRWPFHCCTVTSLSSAKCPSWRSLQGMEIPSEGPVTTNELYLRCDTTRMKFNMSIAKCCQWSEPQFQPTRYVVVLVVDTEASEDERSNQFGYCWTAGSENHTCSM